MADFLTALGLVLVIEGVLYALFPGTMRRMMALMITQPPVAVRAAGLAGAALGVVIVWLVRG
ncbi:MAG TPA: DUF2065 domain-containing protein [Alphaproteobacteria bacterium]|nr:DUF2065 domain-containing protein [Alphaproteobacteria bacterium]HYB54631.1 DUF2065 domain-containing protein [Alphaproteobacteria bacterium]